MNKLDIYKTEFEKCYTQEDYEKYFHKYYSHKDNPYVNRARAFINSKQKIKSDNPIGLAVTLLVLAIGFFLFMFFAASSNADNSQDRIAYRIIATIVAAPFIIGAIWLFVKSVFVNKINR